jgi:hypothetical protein
VHSPAPAPRARARFLLRAAGTLAVLTLAAACNRAPAAGAAAEAKQPIEVTVEHPVDSPGPLLPEPAPPQQPPQTP